MLIQSLIDTILNEIFIGTYRAHFNTLANDVADDADTLTLTQAVDGIGDGSYLEIGQELLYVVPNGININAKTMTVLRGVRGTTAVAHLGGSGVNINPRFARSTILHTMIEEATSWPISMYRVATLEVSLPMGTTSVDLADETSFDNIIRPTKVWRQGVATDVNRWIPVRGWRFERDLNGPGGADLFLPPHCSSETLRIQYARPFTGMSAWEENSNIADSGMADSMGDILKYGAAWRLCTGRETRRLFTEIESEGRNAQEVPATASLQLGRSLKLLRDTRLAEEINRLRSYYGIRAL